MRRSARGRAVRDGTWPSLVAPDLPIRVTVQQGERFLTRHQISGDVEAILDTAPVAAPARLGRAIGRPAGPRIPQM
jgi:hypothetical protein